VLSNSNRVIKRAFAVVLLLLTSPTIAHTLTGRVVKIADGDTITVLDARNDQHKIRLSAIDAPERGQPYGTVSGDHLGKLVFGRQVVVHYDKRDQYGRIVGKVIVSGRDANLE
jgi:endonuclease YncB( thermonuclease family)